MNKVAEREEWSQVIKRGAMRTTGTGANGGVACVRAGQFLRTLGQARRGKIRPWEPLFRLALRLLID